MAYLLEKGRSALLVLRINAVCSGPSFLPSSVESCGCDHGISSTEEEACPSSRKNERSMAMSIFLLSPVESCGGDHGLLERRRFALPTAKKKRRMIMATFLSSSE